jgi:hypothetical protein
MHIISEGFHVTGLLEILMSKDCNKCDNSTVNNAACSFLKVRTPFYILIQPEHGLLASLNIYRYMLVLHKKM